MQSTINYVVLEVQYLLFYAYPPTRFTIDQSPGRICARACLAVASSSMKRKQVRWSTSAEGLKNLSMAEKRLWFSYYQELPGFQEAQPHKEGNLTSIHSRDVHALDLNPILPYNIAVITNTTYTWNQCC